VQLECSEAQHVQVLAVHGVLACCTEEGVEVDLRDMPIRNDERPRLNLAAWDW
jgi:hypothetical protein